VEALQAGGHKHNTQKKAKNCRKNRTEQKLQKKDMLRGMGEGFKEQYRRRNSHQIDQINRSRHTCEDTLLHKISFFKKVAVGRRDY
jgi:50S ribosomal subunit-associated GTPase HflX